MAKFLAVRALHNVAEVLAPALQVTALVSSVAGALVHIGRCRRGLHILAVGTVVEDLTHQTKLVHTLVLTRSTCCLPTVETVVAKVSAELVLVLEALVTVLVKDVPNVVDVLVAVLVALLTKWVNHEVSVANFTANVVRGADPATCGHAEEVGPEVVRLRQVLHAREESQQRDYCHAWNLCQAQPEKNVSVGLQPNGLSKNKQKLPFVAVPKT